MRQKKTHLKEHLKPSSIAFSYPQVAELSLLESYAYMYVYTRTRWSVRSTFPRAMISPRDALRICLHIPCGAYRVLKHLLSNSHDLITQIFLLRGNLFFCGGNDALLRVEL